MSIAKQAAYISPQAYLKAEVEREIKHEYVDGAIYAVAGASPNHGRIATNIAVKFGSHLADSVCECVNCTAPI